jgi:TP901-1 family phage major tail protein
MPEMSGSDVLLLVNTGSIGSPIYTAVGSQTGVKRTETTGAIDITSKNSRARRVLPGEYGSSLSLDALYVPDDASFQALKDAMRNGDLIKVRISDDGVELEEAAALITSMAEDYPDKAAATIAVALTIDGEWTELTS